MSVELALAGVLLATLTLYVVTGGADFGGGVWDLFASGPRAARQRDLVTHAIGPIWEANHVWLILAIVLLFVCWPPVYVRLSVLLHVPLSLMLLGIVLRGSAFVFRAHDSQRAPVRRRWDRTFAIASLLTPLTFGMCVGAIASGALSAAPAAAPTSSDLFAPWTRPFPIAVGLLAIALFAFLAASYLVNETREPDLREDFRRRALVSGGLALTLAALALVLARDGAPRLFARLVGSMPSPLLLGGAALAALIALGALGTRRFALARLTSPAFASILVWGWAWGQYPRLIEPDLDLFRAAAPARDVLGTVLLGVVAGGALLVPSLIVLFRVFKARPADSAPPADPRP